MEENEWACIPMNGDLLRNILTLLNLVTRIMYIKFEDLVHPSFVSTLHPIQLSLNHVCAIGMIYYIIIIMLSIIMYSSRVNVEILLVFC